jgi:uncharacterized protein YdhG (YjbR/CyaY superfamily)
MSVKPQNHEHYLATLTDNKRAALEQLRETIKAAAPEADEVISYQLPAFRLGGKVLVGYGATAKHCALYLFSSSIVAGFEDDLRGYDTSKGTVRFKAAEPLPASLVHKLVQARIAENLA